MKKIYNQFNFLVKLQHNTQSDPKYKMVDAPATEQQPSEQPAAAESQPAAAESQPAAAESQPAAAESQPAAGEGN